MDAQLCRSFFLEPQLTFHRRYEALRAFFVEDRPVAEIAAQFGYKPTALHVMIRRFRAQVRRGQVPPFSSPTVAGDHRADRVVKTGTAPKNPPSRTSGS
jgi:transposase-like protein